MEGIKDKIQWLKSQMAIWCSSCCSLKLLIVLLLQLDGIPVPDRLFMALSQVGSISNSFRSPVSSSSKQLKLCKEYGCKKRLEIKLVCVRLPWLPSCQCPRNGLILCGETPKVCIV